jgi:hypothetical protein
MNRFEAAMMNKATIRIKYVKNFVKLSNVSVEFKAEPEKSSTMNKNPAIRIAVIPSAIPLTLLPRAIESNAKAISVIIGRIEMISGGKRLYSRSCRGWRGLAVADTLFAA